VFNALSKSKAKAGRMIFLPLEQAGFRNWFVLFHLLLGRESFDRRGTRKAICRPVPTSGWLHGEAGRGQGK
jgi:hypothetical protein